MQVIASLMADIDFGKIRHFGATEMLAGVLKTILAAAFSEVRLTTFVGEATSGRIGSAGLSRIGLPDGTPWRRRSGAFRSAR